MKPKAQGVLASVNAQSGELPERVLEPSRDRHGHEPRGGVAGELAQGTLRVRVFVGGVLVHQHHLDLPLEVLFGLAAAHHVLELRLQSPALELPPPEGDDVWLVLLQEVGNLYLVRLLHLLPVVLPHVNHDAQEVAHLPPLVDHDHLRGRREVHAHDRPRLARPGVRLGGAPCVGRHPDHGLHRLFDPPAHKHLGFLYPHRHQPVLQHGVEVLLQRLLKHLVPKPVPLARLVRNPPAAPGVQEVAVAQVAEQLLVVALVQPDAEVDQPVLLGLDHLEEFLGRHLLVPFFAPRQHVEVVDLPALLPLLRVPHRQAPVVLEPPHPHLPPKLGVKGDLFGRDVLDASKHGTGVPEPMQLRVRHELDRHLHRVLVGVHGPPVVRRLVNRVVGPVAAKPPHVVAGEVPRRNAEGLGHLPELGVEARLVPRHAHGPLEPLGGLGLALGRLGDVLEVVEGLHVGQLVVAPRPPHHRQRLVVPHRPEQLLQLRPALQDRAPRRVVVEHTPQVLLVHLVAPVLLTVARDEGDVQHGSRVLLTLPVLLPLPVLLVEHDGPVLDVIVCDAADEAQDSVDPFDEAPLHLGCALQFRHLQHLAWLVLVLNRHLLVGVVDIEPSACAEVLGPHHPRGLLQKVLPG
mmetsp:Transcript_28485/g.69756  ORF Transcript_28485/g.69756 Transcript_28485/m.69756 type:complete len:631 (-) Transcript_28485:141-2033(-)